MTVSVRVRSLDTLVEHFSIEGTQRDLAHRVGLSPTSIHLLLQGKRKSVALDTAVRIEEALDLPPGTLFVLEIDEQASRYLALVNEGAA